MYVCVKAKLTLVSFFFTFFYAPSPRGKCFKCFPFFRGPFPGALLRIWSFCIFCINNPYCTLDCLLHCIPLLYFTLMPLTPYVAMAAEDWEWRRVDLGGLVTEKKDFNISWTRINCLTWFCIGTFPWGSLLKEGGGLWRAKERWRWSSLLKEFAFAPMK